MVLSFVPDLAHLGGYDLPAYFLCATGVLKELTFIRGTGISWVAILRSEFKI